MNNEIFTKAEYDRRVRALRMTPVEYVHALGMSESDFTQFANHTKDALTSMVTGDDHNDVLGKFRYAYEFRFGMNNLFMPERERQKLLSIAFDSSLQGILFHTDAVLPEDRIIVPDDAFKQNLLGAFNDVVGARKGIVTFAREVNARTGDLASVNKAFLQEQIAQGMTNYWNKTPIVRVGQWNNR